MLPPSMWDKNTFKIAIKRKLGRSYVSKTPRSLTDTVNKQVKSYKLCIYRPVWSKAEAALETTTGQKASEPGHPTLQSEAAQHDNGNHETQIRKSLTLEMCKM